jgi:hypothetical protein
MASSSRPFESQTVSRLMAGYRNLQHGAKKLFLKGQLALLWGAQVVAFPAYVVVQSLRTGYRRLQTKHPLRSLAGLLTGKPVQDIPVTADTPIRALLSVIQPQIAAQQGWLQPVNYHGAFLRQSYAGGVLTSGGWHLLPVQEPIRGIASDLVTRKLVLVTSSNRLFEGLTEYQQRRLEAAIALLLAEHAAHHKQRRLNHLRRQPGLPLPQVEAVQWPVVRWLHRGMRWMQTGGLATLTNLFGEAHQGESLQKLKARQTARLTQSAPLVKDEPEWMQPRSFLPADMLVEETRHPHLAVRHPKADVSASVLEREQHKPVGTLGSSIQSNGQFNPLEREVAELNWPSEIDTIEVRVSRVDYIDHWFVQALRGIDKILLWLEQAAQRLWQRLHER